MKCRTCKYWTEPKFGLGKCEGITAQFIIMIIPVDNSKPGAPLLPQDQKRKGKLIKKRSGIACDATFILTPSDFYCSNWRQK
jgi:hypothetical protein